MTYAQFTLTPADLAEFQTSEYQACMARAGRDAYRATREVSCESDRKDLLEARLRSTMVSAQPAARGPRQQRYLDDQALRARTRNNACKAKFIGLGEYSVPFIRATGPCEAEETFRRIKWLERQR